MSRSPDFLHFFTCPGHCHFFFSCCQGSLKLLQVVQKQQWVPEMSRNVGGSAWVGDIFADYHSSPHSFSTLDTFKQWSQLPQALLRLTVIDTLTSAPATFMGNSNPHSKYKNTTIAWLRQHYDLNNSFLLGSRAEKVLLLFPPADLFTPFFPLCDPRVCTPAVLKWQRCVRILWKAICGLGVE